MLETLIESLSTYGFPIVISAVLLFLGILFAKYYFKNFFLTKESMLEVMVQREKELTKIDIEAHRNQYNLDIKRNAKINDRLTELLYSINCSRVSLFQLHNGGIFLSSKQSYMLKFTATHCKIKPKTDIVNSLNLWKDMPISIINSFLSDISDCGCYKVLDIEVLKDKDPSLYHILFQQGILAIVSYALYDDHNHIIGWVSCEFDSVQDESVECNLIQDITRSINLHLI